MKIFDFLGGVALLLLSTLWTILLIDVEYHLSSVDKLIAAFSVLTMVMIGCISISKAMKG